MSVSLARWCREIGTIYFRKYLKSAPKTFKKYFSTSIKILLTLLLLSFYHFLRKNTILYALKQTYLSKNISQSWCRSNILYKAFIPFVRRYPA